MSWAADSSWSDVFCISDLFSADWGRFYTLQHMSKFKGPREKWFIKWQHFRGNATANAAVLLPAVKLYHCPKKQGFVLGEFSINAPCLIVLPAEPRRISAINPSKHGGQFHELAANTVTRLLQQSASTIPKTHTMVLLQGGDGKAVNRSAHILFSAAATVTTNIPRQSKFPHGNSRRNVWHFTFPSCANYRWRFLETKTT